MFSPEVDHALRLIVKDRCPFQVGEICDHCRVAQIEQAPKLALRVLSNDDRDELFSDRSRADQVRHAQHSPARHPFRTLGVGT